MKKSVIVAFILSLIMLFSTLTVNCAEGFGSVVDNSGALSRQDINTAKNYIDQAYIKYGYTIAVVFEDVLDEYERESISENYYRNNNFSQKGGILLYVGVESRVYKIYRFVSNKTTKIDGDELDYIDSAVSSTLHDNRFGDAVVGFAYMALEAIENGEEQNFVLGTKTLEDVLLTLFVSFTIGLGVSLIIMFVMKSKMKTVRPQATATGYAVFSSFKLKESRDSFLYSRVSRVAKSQNSSSGGGGGSSGGNHRGGRF